MARLRPLSEHDNIRFGEGSHDVRNWSVRTRVDDHKVGKVHDVLLDENERTRYMDVELDGGRHVLMPSGDAEVDPSAKVVHVPGLDSKGMAKLPEYDHKPDTITGDYARSITRAYDDAYAGEHHERADYHASWARGTDRTPTGKLSRLDELDDVKVASGTPDPRGWEVVDTSGHRIGKVNHLIGDTGSMKARYLTVDLDDEVATESRRQVLVPVGHVDLDTDRNRVLSRAVDRERVTGLPAYEGGPIKPDYESKLTRTYGEAYDEERHYEHPRYRSREARTDEARVQRAEEEVAVGKREREAGEVDVRKRVEKERVREPVEVHHEEVEVERRAATGRAREDQMGDEEIRVPVHEEEVVVEKQPRVKEEVVVKKKDVAETEVVEEDVRKERVDVERKNSEGRRR